MLTIKHTVIFFLTIGILVNVSNGHFRMPQYVPVERLIKNATDYIQKNPKDASGYYTLGRIHYIAFVNKAFLVGAFNEDPPSIIPFWWLYENYRGYLRDREATRILKKKYGYESMGYFPYEIREEYWARLRAIKEQLDREKWQPEMPTNEQLVEHVGAAQWNFYKAIALDPDNALYYLGQASLGKQYFDFLQKTCPAPLPATTKAIILNTVKETYLLAYNLSIKKDLELEKRPISGLRSIISYEAGSAFVRLWNLESKIPPEIQEKIIGIKQNLKTLETLRSAGITPIIFSLQENSSLSELLACDRIVPFDMDGNGYIEKRPWVKPSTGFLVWDSNGDGRITSGRELFGSVTWWLFFPNGFRAMDMLDDNRDGFLTDGEFYGISVWFDRNSNGQSDIGEIVSLESLGITKIVTRPNGYDGKSPMHSAGLCLKNGLTLPTYDWVSPSVQSHQETSLP